MLKARFLFFVILSLILTSSLSAQSQPSTDSSKTKSFTDNKIQVVPAFVDKYVYQGKEINREGEFDAIMSNVKNVEIRDLQSSSTTLRSVANVFAFVGGALIGWPLGSAISGKEFETGLFVSGIGVVGVAVIFQSMAASKQGQIVELYNKHIDDKTLLNLHYRPSNSSIQLGFQYQF